MANALPDPPDGAGLAALETRLRYDLDCLCYPANNWVPPRRAGARPVSDVVIVGGGMCGMLAWLALRSAGISNVRVLDRNPPGLEGPWMNYARMETLRSPKQLVGPAFGIGALTFQAWYRARFGAAAWRALDKIPRPLWMDYLRWYRSALNVPIENGVALTRVAPRDDLLRLDVRDGDRDGEILTRKLIYATGREGTGRATIPDFIGDLPRTRWAHSSHDIDFAALRGRRVAVVGAGASAVENAATALEAGAAEARLLIRRAAMPTINKMMGIGSYGFTAGYAELPDHWRWRFMRYSFVTQTPAPRGSTLRVSRHDNAYFHFGKSIVSLRDGDDALRIEFSDGARLDTDYLILGTGFTTDPMARSELGAAAADILLWRDVYTPPADERCDELGAFPYLADDFSFRTKTSAAADWLNRVYCFNYGATASLGKVSGDIPGVSEGARWLAQRVAARLYAEDIDLHWRHLQDYSKPELQGDEWTASPLPPVRKHHEAL